MSVPYGVEVAGPARRGLRRLPERVAPALVEFITGVLRENPLSLSQPLVGELGGLRSARRGDYRVLFWIDDETATVVVVRIAHRSEVYRPQ